MSVFTILLRVAYALGILGVLGFGAVTAMGSARSAGCPLPPDPPMMGTCTSPMDCQELCDDFYGQSTHTGLCREDQCCLCIA